MNRAFIAAVCVIALGASVTLAADQPLVVDVWPGATPGDTRKIGPESMDKKSIEILKNVSKPTLTIYRPAKEKDTGASVIICPGGGYNILAWDLEGTEVAEWLNKAGVTGIILKYRVPDKRGPVHGFGPLMDAQRTVSLVRSKSKEWGLDSKKIGILGFSAGGNLSALACTNFETRSYDAADDIDKESCRPDFGVLIYPAYLADDKTLELSPLLPVTGKTPPIFFALAADDKVTATGSAVLYLALKKAGVSAELHVYSMGGHGYGLRPTTRPATTWPARCEEWMRSQGIIGTVEKK